MELGRRVTLDIAYNNQNISRDIEIFATEVSYTDNMIGEADDISLTLADRERNWIGPWMPSKGASLIVSLLISGWESKNTIKRKLGYFEIDEIEVNGPPSVAIIKGLSVPESSSLRGEQKSRSWEKTNFKKVVQDIADKNKLKVYFGFSENPDFDRLEQEYETDIAFLKRICTDAGFALKVANNRITIFDEIRFENDIPVDTIKRTDIRVIDYRFVDKLNGIYRSCKVEYTNAKQKKTYRYTFTPPKPPKTSKILVVNEEVKSQAAAITLSKKKLREANKEAVTGALKLVGVSPYYSGQTVILSEFGNFNGKYIIISISGTVGKGSETEIKIRKCLEGY